MPCLKFQWHQLSTCSLLLRALSLVQRVSAQCIDYAAANHWLESSEQNSMQISF